LKISAKKVVFLVSSGKKQISSFFAPLEKFQKIPYCDPPGKNPSNAHRSRPTENGVSFYMCSAVEVALAQNIRHSSNMCVIASTVAFRCL